jgi:hypothetical protein
MVRLELFGTGEDGHGWSAEDEMAFMEYNNLIRDKGLVRNLGNQKDPQALLTPELVNNAKNLSAGLWSEEGGCFVKDEIPRLHDHHRGQGQSLLLPSGKLCGGKIAIVSEAKTDKMLLYKHAHPLRLHPQVL